MTERSLASSYISEPLSGGTTFLSACAAARAFAQPAVVGIFFCTMLCSSGLLFLVEPMFARLLLPLLGGTPGVWNTCMVCFQALVQGAYAWGHWSIRWLGVRRQALVQLALLAMGAVALPIAIPRGWSPPTGQNPMLWLLAVLAAGVGLPFFAVATTAPVLQRWFSTTGHRSGGDPYFLYAASNLGSLGALIAYPTVVERVMHLWQQTHLWSTGYVCLIALTASCAIFAGRAEEADAGTGETIAMARRLRWIVLAMVPSSLLLGTTTFITTDIAAVPLLWIAPLVLYLLSFVLVFASRQVLPHRLMVRLQPICVVWVALFMLGRVGQPVWMVLALHLACLFVSSMACHGALAADRPSAGRLTDFYLMMSLGGVVGGMFNALAAPLLFKSAAEYPIALVAACAVCMRAKPYFGGIQRREMILDLGWSALVGGIAWGLPQMVVHLAGPDAISLRMLAIGVAVMAAGLAIGRRRRFVAALAMLFLVAGTSFGHGQILITRRSFFGIHRVVRNLDGPFNDIYHGSTVHGRQWVDPATGEPVRATEALTYYSRGGPIGQILAQDATAKGGKRIDVVGLGVGSLAAYAQPGDRLTYFEIDPAVRWIAEDSGYFTFVRSARQRGADVRIIMGDARLTLRNIPSASCDLLVIDAFCGDAIPVHLITRQAMSIYLDKLAPEGILAFHVSNMYLDLLPICSALARDSGCEGWYRDDLDISPQRAAEGVSASQWVAMARNGRTLAWLHSDVHWQPLPICADQAAWTDDYSNILSVFRWK